MLRLMELFGAIRDLQECSRALPGTLWGAFGELSESSWGALEAQVSSSSFISSSGGNVAKVQSANE